MNIFDLLQQDSQQVAYWSLILLPLFLVLAMFLGLWVIPTLRQMNAELEDEIAKRLTARVLHDFLDNCYDVLQDESGASYYVDDAGVTVWIVEGTGANNGN